MQVTQEARAKHTILSYDNAQITIDHIKYDQSVIIGASDIIIDWPVQHQHQLNEDTLVPLLQLQPEIIIIGVHEQGVSLPVSLLQYLSKSRIGIECMNIGAACRTFNVLLGEHRAVVAGIILNAN